MQAEKYEDNSLAAFILTFFTFFLDNVLLTVVVPMLAPWVQPETGSGEADKSGRWAAAAGTVLGAKAGTQLLSCGAAAAAVRVAAPTRVLRAGTMLLLASSFVLCTVSTWRGPLAAGALLLARVFHGAGAALASVAGWAVCARRPNRLRRLLPATAAGVMAGYVLGAVSEKGILPFALIAAALAADLALQYKYLGNDDYSNYTDPHPYSPATEAGYSVGALAAAGGVFVSAAVVATLEPCLPTILHTQCGVVFISDSVGYLVGSCGRGRGRRGAAAGLLAVAVAAALTTRTTQVWQVCITQFLLGLGIGTIDVALFPAVIAPDSDEIENNLKNNITQKLSLTSEDKAVIKDINTNKIGDYKQLYYNNDILDSNDESDNTHLNPFIHICDVTTDDDEENEKNRRSCEDESLVKNKDLEELLISTKPPCLENTAVLPVPVLPVPLSARDARSASHAALLHGASSAACAIGGVAGGLCAWWASLDRCLLALAAVNALYAVFILRVMPTQVFTSAAEKKTREPKETSQLIAAK